MLQGGLRARGSTFGKEEKKLWEMGVRAATTVTDLRDHLLAFEQVVREVQEVDDERDEVCMQRISCHRYCTTGNDLNTFQIGGRCQTSRRKKD
jgi:hypothetical protein